MSRSDAVSGSDPLPLRPLSDCFQHSPGPQGFWTLPMGRSPAPRGLSSSPLLLFQQHRQETRRADKWVKMLRNWDHYGPSEKVGAVGPRRHLSHGVG